MDGLREFLKKRRAELGYTQTHIAGALGYSSPQYISNVERGTCFFPRGRVRKLAKVLETSVEDLVERMILDFIADLKKDVGLK